MRLRRALLFPVVLVSLACSSNSPEQQSGGASGTSAGGSPTTAGSAGTGGASAAPGAAGSGAGASSAVIGSFRVTLTGATDEAGATVSVVGKVSDGPTPVTTIWENPVVDGDCTLTTPRIPFCETPCGGSAACVEDDTCQPYPTGRSVGPVNVSGLAVTAGDSPFIMKAIANNYQPPADVMLAYPPFAEGDSVTFAATGDYFPAFSLTAPAVAALEMPNNDLKLTAGQPLSLTWTAGSLRSATIHVKLDISHHGGSKGQIECDTDDDGSLEISAALVQRLLDLGVAGFPAVIVSRHSLDSTQLSPGRVELDLASVVERLVSIDGLTSCHADSDCPKGQACQANQACK
jgi:hypothetical protein